MCALGAVLMAASCAAQIFPFSNLKHIFDQKGKAGARATTSVTTVESTTTLAPPTTTDLLVPFFGPYAAYDQDDGYRGLQRPEYVVEKPKLAKTAARKPTASVWRPTSGSKPPPPTTTTALRAPTKHPKLGGEEVKHNKRLVDTTARPQRPRFVQTAYEPSDYNDLDLAGAYSNDLHEHPLGNGDMEPLELLELLEPPARYLTPPRLPGMLGDAPPSVTDVAPAPSSPHEARATADDTATPTAPMPPVPATYLRPPGPPGPSDGPVLFTLGLADVADAATSLSTNPAIKMGHPPWSPAVSPAATDWAPAALAPAKATKPAKSTSHKAASTPAPGNALPGPGSGKSGKPGKPQGFPKHRQAAHADKVRAQGPQGGVGLHESDADGDFALPLVESSATDSAAAGTAVGRPGHPGALQPTPRPPAPPRVTKPKNHNLASSASAPPSRAIKHLNHRPGGAGLREDESKTRPRYYKRPLHPLEQVRPIDRGGVRARSPKTEEI